MEVTTKAKIYNRNIILLSCIELTQNARLYDFHLARIWKIEKWQLFPRLNMEVKINARLYGFFEKIKFFCTYRFFTFYLMQRIWINNISCFSSFGQNK